MSSDNPSSTVFIFVLDHNDGNLLSSIVYISVIVIMDTGSVVFWVNLHMLELPTQIYEFLLTLPKYSFIHSPCSVYVLEASPDRFCVFAVERLPRACSRAQHNVTHSDDIYLYKQ